jgi:hypothetical protein
LRRRSDPLVLCLWLCLSRTASAYDPPGLTLETGSPDALCPDLGQTREAVKRRLGSLEVAGRRGWRVRYTIGHAPEGNPRDFVRLELFTPEGALELARDLPMRGESCSTMAEVIALVLDRHFRSLSLEDHSSSSSALPDASELSTESDSAVIDETPKEVGAPSAPVTSARVVSRPSRHTTAAGAATPGRSSLILTAELSETTHGSRQALGLRGLAGLGRNLHFGGMVSFDLAHETQALRRGGRVEASSSQTRAFLAWGLPFGPLLTYAGPGFGLRLQRGQAEDLPRSTDLFRAIWTGGLEAGLAVHIERRFVIQAAGALELTLRPLSGKYYVEDEEVLRPSSIQGWVGLGAGYAFYP